MGGRSLDQFNSRQQARAKNVKEGKEVSPKSHEQDKTDDSQARPAKR